MDQEPENQLAELRRYVAARGWTAVEYVDRGVSGAKDKRPALDELVRDAKRRRFDVLVCWRLDRLGRNLRAPDSAARRVARRGRGIRQPCRGDRRDDACRQAPAARARRDRRVRAGEDCRTRPGRLGAGRGARSDARATQARAWSRAADDQGYPFERQRANLASHAQHSNAGSADTSACRFPNASFSLLLEGPHGLSFGWAEPCWVHRLRARPQLGRSPLTESSPASPAHLSKRQA